MIPISIRVQSQDFDIAAEVDRARAVGGNVGAIVTFSGICRNEDGKLTALELEHYPGMAEAEIERIAKQAASRWPVTAITVIHRHGLIAVGDNIVLVVAASSHRQAAFEAASFLMDFLKTRAPFWKKEHAAGAVGAWIAAKGEDDTATKRWEAEKTSTDWPR